MHTLSRGNNENDASTQTDLDKLLYSIEFCGPVEADMSASRDPCGIPRPTKEAGGKTTPARELRSGTPISPNPHTFANDLDKVCYSILEAY